MGGRGSDSAALMLLPSTRTWEQSGAWHPGVSPLEFPGFLPVFPRSTCSLRMTRLSLSTLMTAAQTHPLGGRVLGTVCREPLARAGGNMLRDQRKPACSHAW